MAFPASPPMDFAPVAAKAHIPAYNDAISNNPCALVSLIAVAGVNVAAQNLCRMHYAMQYGLNVNDLRGIDAAFGATAGTPGSFTPAGTSPPASVADLIAGRPVAVAASPATAWTTGQRVVCADGSTAYWNGTAWVAGTAP